MPHPEREHSLQIEVARLRREVEIATNGWVAEKARSDLYAAEARGLELTLATAESALAAARRECEGLRKLLRTATVRIGILLDRMRGCNDEVKQGRRDKDGHDLSLFEGEAWIDEQNAALAGHAAASGEEGK